MTKLEIEVGPVRVELLNDDRICQSIIGGKPFEPDTLRTWAEMCVPGSEVLDVGAYSGLFSIAAAKLGARAVAIEPFPAMADRLAINARDNGVKVMLIRAAASSTIGRTVIHFNERVHLTSGASLARKSGAALLINTVTLDSLALENVSAVKIDVERYELEVLRGAMDMLRTHKPRLLIEALDATAVAAVATVLAPLYRQADYLDERNMLLEPL